jgi:hypothetical protein
MLHHICKPTAAKLQTGVRNEANPIYSHGFTEARSLQLSQINLSHFKALGNQ